MLGLKDIESLRKESAILCIPLFSFALIQDSWIENVSTFLLSNGLNYLNGSITKVLSFVVIVTLAMAIFLLLNYGILRGAWWFDNQKQKEDPTRGRSRLLQWIGLLLITAGLFALSPLVGLKSTSPLNIFWHLGFLAYGYFFYDRSGY
jgi:hypothetical protein